MNRILLGLLFLLAGVAVTLAVADLLKGPSQPVTTGINLASTVLTAVATLALALFAAAQIRDAQRQQRGVAAALLEEVHRIRTELGARPREGEDVLIVTSRTAGFDPDRAAIITDAVTPEITEWFHDVIPRIAESEGAVVGSFLTLDRHLFNYRDRVRALVQALTEDNEARGVLERWRAANPNAVAMDAVMARDELQHELAMKEAGASAAKVAAITLYRACHATLDTLEKQLRRLLR